MLNEIESVQCRWSRQGEGRRRRLGGGGWEEAAGRSVAGEESAWREGNVRLLRVASPRVGGWGEDGGGDGGCAYVVAKRKTAIVHSTRARVCAGVWLSSVFAMRSSRPTTVTKHVPAKNSHTIAEEVAEGDRFW